MALNKKVETCLIELSVIPAVGAAIYYWGDSQGWNTESLTRLSVFPLLGLLAFTIMWWHFLVGFFVQARGINKMKKYHLYSGYLVFALLVLHPLLLTIEIRPLGLTWFDYVGPGQGGFITLGILSLMVFLLYDLARWMREKPLFRDNWHIVDALDDAAFIAVFIHAVKLGTHLQAGWLLGLWWFYGLSGLVFILYKHYANLTNRSSNSGYANNDEVQDKKSS